MRQALESPRQRAVRPGRKPVHPASLQPSLVTCWSVLRGPAGKLLSVATGCLVSMLRAERVLDITDAEAELLVDMSAATINRRLDHEREDAPARALSHRARVAVKGPDPYPDVGRVGRRGTWFRGDRSIAGLPLKPSMAIEGASLAARRHGSCNVRR